MDTSRTYCRNGKHVLEEVGKTNDGRCRVCTKEAARRTYMKHHESRLARQKAANEVRKLARQPLVRQPKLTCRSGKHPLATAGKTPHGSCLECAREAARRSHALHREERNRKMRVAYLSEHNPKRLQRIRDYDKARVSYDKERARGLRRSFGMTVAEYSEMFMVQRGVCAICCQPETATFKGSTKPLAVDHDHATNQRRALLCAKCNRGLGLFNDSPALLIAAADYLRRFQQPTSGLDAASSQRDAGPELPSEQTF